MSTGPPNLLLMPHAAAPARPEARSGPPSRSRDRVLIDAALAVNEAGELDDALQLLVRVGQQLIAADRVSVAVWDEALQVGVLRAAEGIGADAVGARIKPGVHHPYRKALAGEPVVSRKISTEGLDPTLPRRSRGSRPSWSSRSP